MAAIKPTVPHFWDRVAQMVPGKSADECQTMWLPPVRTDGSSKASSSSSSSSSGVDAKQPRSKALRDMAARRAFMTGLAQSHAAPLHKSIHGAASSASAAGGAGASAAAGSGARMDGGGSALMDDSLGGEDDDDEMMAAMAFATSNSPAGRTRRSLAHAAAAVDSPGLLRKLDHQAQDQYVMGIKGTSGATFGAASITGLHGMAGPIARATAKKPRRSPRLKRTAAADDDDDDDGGDDDDAEGDDLMGRAGSAAAGAEADDQALAARLGLI